MILRSALNFLHSTRAGGGLQCCGTQISVRTHRYESAELGLRTRSAMLFYYSSRYCRFSALNSGCRGCRAGNHMSGSADIRRACLSHSEV
eukprot:2563815-Pyramimonas_sp.AAC.1